ncbi:MAG: retroviral-like aspartic protease family protein [Bacteroidales bacterium]|nr:retroviral-like aspartic protease family protein [Bacteroidales bacterium]
MEMGDVYADMELREQALKCYESAIKLKPSNNVLEDLYQSMGELYYSQEQYALSTQVYEKILAINSNNKYALVGIARNLNTEKKFSESLTYLNKAILLYNRFSRAYAFRAESYIGLKQYNYAADDIITALDIDGDNKAYHLLGEFTEPEAIQVILTKLKIKQMKDPNSVQWVTYPGLIYQSNKEYRKAIEYYKIGLKKEQLNSLLYWTAQCYSQLGDNENALEYVNRILDMDSTDVTVLYLKSQVLYAMGKPQKAADEVTKCINKYPDISSYYFARAWYERYVPSLDSALEDINTVITLEPDYISAYNHRGRLYLLKGEKDKAEKDFKYVISKDTTQTTADDQFAYAYIFAGNTDKALQIVDRIQSKDTGAHAADSVSYYNLACLYSLLNQKEKALTYLKKALEDGDINFYHYSVDSDLDNIRELPEYKSLIDEYKSKVEYELSTTDNAVNYVDKVVEVPFTREGKVCKVQCTINGLSLYFYFDTGASDVTISNVEASFMMKNGYLTKEDISGTQRYLNANGEMSEGTVIHLKTVEFAGLTLNDIQASVVKSQNAPLLLGQSVIQKLGKVEIDNEKNVLKITYRVKSEE